ncbi:arsenate reductase family protein [Paenibacillus sp. FJAT-26967]|uniref:arsenate reductase family protein n=1 Tax=Paenibacillus sp. FJAT-26967 TaxID=1729690 RepID=UPI001560ED97|nr:arsenate reductase family protein [Paenibacillus sp. FJAT-26967]
MMKVTVYEYSKCSTCRNALKWLRNKGLEPNTIPLFEQPPTADELRILVRSSGLDIKKFFNTSGEVYREMALKDKLDSMSEDEKLALLASNGRLIKRPIVTDGRQVTVGFKEADFEQVWG